MQNDTDQWSSKLKQLESQLEKDEQKHSRSLMEKQAEIDSLLSQKEELQD